MAPAPPVERLCKHLCDSLSQGKPLDEGLAELLELTQARATGLWRRDGQRLVLLGFRGADDMPDAVKGEFVEATRSVSLTQTGLGIVQAVVSGAPALSFVDAQPRTPATSAGWLARFGAARSVAVPVVEGDRVIGVIAISTAQELKEGDRAWQVMSQVARSISKALLARGPGG